MVHGEPELDVARPGPARVRHRPRRHGGDLRAAAPGGKRTAAGRFRQHRLGLVLGERRRRIACCPIPGRWTAMPPSRRWPPARSARWELAYAPEDEEAMARHRADMEAHRPFRDFTYTLIGQDGSRVSIRTSGKPIFAEDGAFLGYRGTASDITQLRAAKAMLDQRTRALEEAHRLGKIGTWSSPARHWPHRLGARTLPASRLRPRHVRADLCEHQALFPGRRRRALPGIAETGDPHPSGPRPSTCASCTRTARRAIWR